MRPRAQEQRAGFGGGRPGEALGERARHLEVLIIDRIAPAAAPFGEAVLRKQRDHRS